MAAYSIRTPNMFRKQWDMVRADCIRAATKKAIDQIWPDGSARLYKQIKLSPDYWRITVQLWGADNIAFYETLYLYRTVIGRPKNGIRTDSTQTK